MDQKRSSLRFDITVATLTVLSILVTVCFFESRKNSQTIVIRDWLVLAGIPFQSQTENSVLEKDWLTQLGGEANARPKEQMTILLQDGTEIPWVSASTLETELALLPFNRNPLGKTEGILGYAFSSFKLETEGKYSLLISHDDSVKVWVNGKVVFSEMGPRSFNGPLATIPLSLDAGNNFILIKVSQLFGGWGCSAQIVRSKNAL